MWIWDVACDDISPPTGRYLAKHSSSPTTGTCASLSLPSLLSFKHQQKHQHHHHHSHPEEPADSAAPNKGGSPASDGGGRVRQEWSQIPTIQLRDCTAFNLKPSPAMIIVGHTCRHHPGPELYFGGKIKDCNVVSQRLFVPQRVLQHSSNTNVPVEENAYYAPVGPSWN